MADKNQPKAKKVKQIIGALAATMGGFSLGTVIGWSAPAGDILQDNKFSNHQISHISSIMCIGAACAQVYLALTMDRIGRKWTMIVIAVPFVAAWIILGMFSNFYIFLLGRFLTGFCGGAFCVAAPTYIGEFSEKEIRGALGVMFQLLLVIGILFSFAFGLAHNMYLLCFPMIVPPVVCLVMMFFLPESPVFLYTKGKEDQARKALTFYRGEGYNIEPEMKELTEYSKAGEGTFMDNIKKKPTLKAIVMLLVLHIIQQLSGINAVMFYSTKIFKMAKSDISGDVSTCILGGTQVVVCVLAAFLVDKLGRKLLWLISLGIMAVCLIGLGGYFLLKSSEEKNDVKDKLSDKIAIIPLLLVCIYIAGFCFAAGPLPWAQMGELLPAGAKAICGSVITFVNWMLAYTVTVSYGYLVDAAGAGPVFIGYGVICVLGFLFVLFILIETRNKTLEEIQIELGGDWRADTRADSKADSKATSK